MPHNCSLISHRLYVTLSVDKIQPEQVASVLAYTVSSVTHVTIIHLECYVLNHLKPTGHVMHQQYNIQQLYALPTLYLCVLYLSQNKQRLVPLTA